MAASDRFQRSRETLNISAAVLFDAPADAGVEAIKRGYRSLRRRELPSFTPREALLAARSVVPIGRQAISVGIQRRTYAPKSARLLLGSTMEQEPNYSSRVMLDSTLDALGMPKTVLDWRLSPMGLKTLRDFAEALRGEFSQLGLGEVQLDDWLFDDDANWTEKVSDVAHHMGTVRMSDNQKDGVVDSNCQVHGVDNLYVASTAVYPTSSHSNPTFTLLMLCLRMADRLKTELA
jgi:hypothetical protein